ncbi:MAG TPA: adenosylcobalamin-dependent ribonucleoside-diphosphate reductase [Dissulfurispiraceae bacterium]|nr:adenosylcobalamin-dependent ribonucleoside-diphosphate reductase [Dissulfurispiraceae bacterium]
MLNLSKHALFVLQSRYLRRNESGQIIETPEEMFRRVARAMAVIEERFGNEATVWQERFYQLLTSLRFLPNSPALMHAGKPSGQLAACFVLPVEDTMEGIFDALKNAALILQSGGGTGFSFSRLRPADDVVGSTGGQASGPVSFMKIFDAATDVVKQGGARRGANMGMLRVDHPDILQFIRLKRESGELTNFNISVAVPDSFMDAVKSDSEYALVNPRTGAVVRTLRARKVFDEMVLSAWTSGDPGVVFLDRINEANPTPHLGSFEATNPCGEQPLLPYEACVLGSLNIAAYIKNGALDYLALGDDITLAVRMLDNAVDATHYPIDESARMHRATRKIGLGVMGWADALVKMGIPYESSQACAKARRIMRFIQESAHHTSEALAQERGPFPSFTGSIYERTGMPPRRNATLTTIAPTGTLAIIADCSSGIEPYYSLAYKRRALDTELLIVNKLFVEAAEQSGFYSRELMAGVLQRGTVRGMRTVPAAFRALFRTAHEIHYEAHIEMQAAFQAYTDNAVSKTINMPHRATAAAVAHIIMLAYEKRLKGITIFRAGTKRGTLATISESDTLKEGI